MSRELDFDQWFEGSHVVDAAGRPLCVYHATHHDFERFEIGRETVNSTNFGHITTTRSAIFASTDPAFCETYLKTGRRSLGANIRPLFMSIKSPLDLREGINGEDLNLLLANANGTFVARDFYYLPEHEMWQLFDDEFGENVVAAARAAGFDGVRMIERHPETGRFAEVWAAFDPSQVRGQIQCQAEIAQRARKAALLQHAAQHQKDNYTEGDIGYYEAENAEWTEECLPIDALLHLMPRDEWASWLDDEIQIDESEYGGTRGYRHLKDAYNANASEPITALLRGDDAYIWDGWHRAAAAIVNGATHIQALVGRPTQDDEPTQKRPVMRA